MTTLGVGSASENRARLGETVPNEDRVRGESLPSTARSYSPAETEAGRVARAPANALSAELTEPLATQGWPAPAESDQEVRQLLAVALSGGLNIRDLQGGWSIIVEGNPSIHPINCRRCHGNSVPALHQWRTSSRRYLLNEEKSKIDIAIPLGKITKKFTRYKGHRTRLRGQTSGGFSLNLGPVKGEWLTITQSDQEHGQATHLSWSMTFIITKLIKGVIGTKKWRYFFHRVCTICGQEQVKSTIIDEPYRDVTETFVLKQKQHKENHPNALGNFAELRLTPQEMASLMNAPALQVEIVLPTPPLVR